MNRNPRRILRLEDHRDIFSEAGTAVERVLLILFGATAVTLIGFIGSAWNDVGSRLIEACVELIRVSVSYSLTIAALQIAFLIFARISDVLWMYVLFLVARFMYYAYVLYVWAPYLSEVIDAARAAAASLRFFSV